MKVPAGGGSAVRMYIPPIPRFTTPETFFIPAFCQANIVPFGEERRGYWRGAFIGATREENKNKIPFPVLQKKKIFKWNTLVPTPGDPNGSATACDLFRRFRVPRS